MTQRFGEEAQITYLDVRDTSVSSEHTKLIEEIDTRGLLYPVTVIDGVPVYDGAVSYPAILRAVANKLNDRAAS